MAHPRFVGLRLSTAAGAVPTAADMDEGELAINTVDGRVYTLAGSAVIDLTDRYTVAEIDTLLDGKADASHDHPWAEITGKPATATRWPAVAEVAGLTAALSDKLDAASRYTDAEAVAAAQAAPGWHAAEWDAAYGWGDHALAGYLKSVSWGDVDDKPTFGPAATADTVGSGKVLRQGAAKVDALSNQPDYYSNSGSQEIDLDQVSWGDCILAASSKVLTAEPIPFESSFYYIETQRQYSSSAVVQKVWEYQGNRFAWRSIRAGYTPPPWAMEYTDQNTTVDPSGFVRASGSAAALTTDDAGDFAPSAHTHTLAKIVDAGSAAAKDAEAFDPAGAASSAVSGHESAPDPHGQYVQKVAGKGLSSNDYTDGDKSKLTGIEGGATADQTKTDIDALGIDADTVDGKHADDFDPAGTAADVEQRIRQALRQRPDPLLMHFL